MPVSLSICIWNSSVEDDGQEKSQRIQGITTTELSNERSKAMVNQRELRMPSQRENDKTQQNQVARSQNVSGQGMIHQKKDGTPEQRVTSHQANGTPEQRVTLRQADGMPKHGNTSQRTDGTPKQGNTSGQLDGTPENRDTSQVADGTPKQGNTSHQTNQKRSERMRGAAFQAAIHVYKTYATRRMHADELVSGELHSNPMAFAASKADEDTMKSVWSMKRKRRIATGEVYR